MVPSVQVLVILVLFWIQTSKSQNDYHANVIMEDYLCAIPPYNGPHIECKVTHEDGKYNPESGDCNQDKCTCRYTGQSFTQTCTYNSSYIFTRTCLNFERNCTLYNNVDGGEAICKEKYGKCEIVSEPLKSRLAVGYPQYNPPICYPGFKAARNGCNSTSNVCEGFVKSSFTSTTKQTLKSCNMTCANETASCTNFTKTCHDSFTKWDDRYKSAMSVPRGECDVITKKCNEYREYVNVSEAEGSKSSKHKSNKVETKLVKTYNCSIESNLTSSKEFCVDYIMNNMEYKVECQAYGANLAKYLFDKMYKSTDVSVSRITDYLTSKWEIIKKMCKDDCFTAVTREMRNCVSDLPIQSLLPGITPSQLRFLMYESADLLCASVSDKKTPESCVEYLNINSTLSQQVHFNMSRVCKGEIGLLKKGSTVTCTQKCRDHLLTIATERERDPGCCMADLMKFKKSTSQWMEMLSPDMFNDNLLIQLVEQCSVGDQLRSCRETDGVHPAVIFVLAVIGIFSVAIFSGVVAFIVVFYQQMEYEGYKKGFLHNMIT